MLTPAIKHLRKVNVLKNIRFIVSPPIFKRKLKNNPDIDKALALISGILTTITLDGF